MSPRVMTPGQLLWRWLLKSDATRGCGERRGRPVVSLVPRAMSDSNYAKICQWRKVHEVVDDAWLEDALSDDDVEIPSGDVFAEEGASAAMMLFTYLLLSTSCVTTTLYTHQDR